MSNTKVSVASKHDYQFALIDKLLQVATENKLIINGPYVRDVLVCYKTRLPPINLNADINFWAKSVADWHSFVARLGNLFDVIFHNNTDESGKYQISVLGNVICKGQLLLATTSYNIDIDIDLLMCDDFNEIGLSLISVNDKYTAEQLIAQVIRKEFRVITDRPCPALYKRRSELYDDGWTDITVKKETVIGVKVGKEPEPNKIVELLAASRSITKELNNVYNSYPDYDYQGRATKKLSNQVLQLSKLLENVLETLDK